MARKPKIVRFPFAEEMCTWAIRWPFVVAAGPRGRTCDRPFCFFGVALICGHGISGQFCPSIGLFLVTCIPTVPPVVLSSGGKTCKSATKFS